MVAYFDLENLESLFQQRRTTFHDKCYELLREELDLTFNFNKEEIKSRTTLQFLPNLLSQGAKNNKHEFLSDKFPERPLKSNSHNQFNIDQLNSLFFINDENLSALKDKDDLLIADIGEELELFSLLFLRTNKYQFEEIIPLSQFQSWNDITKYECPFSDLIIVDNFLLKDERLFECNLFSMVKTLISNCVSKKINVVIIVKKGEITTQFTLDQIKSDLSKLIEDKLGVKPNVTIICTYRVHDRFILRNYQFISSGDTFNNYYHTNGSLKSNGEFLSFRSIANKTYLKTYKLLHAKYQDIINTTAASDIIGSKKSRFFNFP